MAKIVIIGGGAAGMMAAIAAAQAGAQVHLFERNEKLGKKIYITGKGRCNVTNACETEKLFEAIMHNKKFMYSAIYGFDNQAMMDFLEKAGVHLKVERGNRVFPVSDHASDIIFGLEREMKRLGVKIHLKSGVKSLVIRDGAVSGVVLDNGSSYPADRVIVATGGKSYAATGSTGDGYRFAQEAGHTLTEPEPSLVPLLTKEAYIPKMQGLALKNVELSIKSGKKTLFKEFGEMLFTHNGISGPLVLSASAYLGKELKKGECMAWIDLKPALTPEQLDARLLREFEAGPNKQFRNVLPALFPSSMIPVMLEIGPIDGAKAVHDISRGERRAFAELTKAFPFTIIGMGSFKEAIVTRGGVNVREILPGTMESKKVRNLYFAGEVLDVDAVTGGYNLQIAWSTGHLAGESAAEETEESAHE